MTTQTTSPPSPSERLRVGREEITILVPGDATGGALLLFEVAMPAGGGPPLMHCHDPEELYLVQTGELAVYVEAADGAVERTPATPGSRVHIPGGRAHTVRNESGEDAVALVVLAPAGGMEAFAREAAGLTAGGPPAMDAVLALAARHGIEMTGPVPAAG